MKTLFLSLVIPALTFGQDTRLEYSKVISLDTMSKTSIYDKCMIWCSKLFTDSKTAIKLSERESGLIEGKATYQSMYKVPGKKDSTYGSVYNNYAFDWLIEIKDGRLRFSFTNISFEYSGVSHPVFVSGPPPVGVMFQKKEKTQTEWDLSKQYLLTNLDRLTISLTSDLLQKKSDW